MADDAVKRLDRMRRAMAKLWREGREAEFRAVEEAYRSLKAEQMAAAEVERREAARSRRAAAPAVRSSGRSWERWRLPRGFASPLAAQRAAAGFEREPMVPDSRRPALRPWRSVSPMEQVVWRPGR